MAAFGDVAAGARYALGAVRVVTGVLGLVTPTFIARRLGDQQPECNAAAIYGIRMFGVRTIVLGLDLFRPPGEALDRALRAAPLIHGSDLATVLALQRSTVLPEPRARPLAAISGLNTLLAVVALAGGAVRKGSGSRPGPRHQLQHPAALLAPDFFRPFRRQETP